MMDWKEFGRSGLLITSWHLPGENEEDHKNPVMLTSALAKI
jgi:hypothetical protein